MANWYVSSVSYAAVPAWQASHAYAVGALVRQLATPTVGNERVFRATTLSGTGTSAASEPTWTITQNGTTTDNAGANQIVWTEVTGIETWQGPVSGAWTAPHARWDNALAWAAATDTIFLSSTHFQTVAANWTPSFTDFTYCVTETAVPPTDANRTKGATCETSGDHGMAPTFQSFFNGPVMDGVKFRAGVGASTGTGSTLAAPEKGFHSWPTFYNCDFEQASTVALGSANPALQFTSAIGSVAYNCTVKLGNVGSVILVTRWTFRDTNAQTFLQGTNIPTLLFNSPNQVAEFERLDLSNVNTTIADAGSDFAAAVSVFRNCKLNSSATLCGGNFTEGRQLIDFLDCDSGTTYRNERYGWTGSNVTSTSVARTSGAAESGVSLSWKATTNGNTKWFLPHELFPIAIWNTVSGSAVNITLEGIADPRFFSALPKNDEAWFDADYLSDAGGSGFQSRATGTKASNLAAGAALTASSQAWDTHATARANSTAYSLGDIRKNANAAGQLWVCTTAGTSAAALGTLYTGIADGAAVTDGTAVFTAMWRFKQTITVTPQQAGYIYVSAKLAKASSVVYFDPLIVLS